MFTRRPRLEEEPYRFFKGLPAFESDHEYRLVTEPQWHPFCTIESLRPHGPRFVCAEVSAIQPGYEIELSEEDADCVQLPAGILANEPSPSKLLAIVNALDDGSLTANLSAPLILNTAARTGVQSIQPAGRYSPVTIILPREARNRC